MSKFDPLRGYYAHPILPAGYNSWDIDGDEVDGAGVNEPIWPVYFDSFESLLVIIITQAMLDAFNTECPDYVPPCQEDTIRFPTEIEVLEITGKAA